MRISSAYLAQLHQAECAFAQTHGFDTAPLERLHTLRADLPLPHNLADAMAVWIAAPCLAAFALWIKAQPQGRLLGVMREGRLLAQLMQKLFALPAQELWINRHTAQLAAFGAGDEEALLNWLVRTRLVPLTRSQALSTLFHESSDDQTQLDLTTAQDLIHSSKSQPFRADCQALMTRLMLHYNSVVPDEATPLFLMDFASVGNIQRSLHTLLQAQGRTDQLIGLNYVTTQGVSWAEAQGCTIFGFLAQAGQPTWLGQAYARTPELIELFAAPALGSLQDYDETGRPILAPLDLNGQQALWAACTQNRLLEAAATFVKHAESTLTKPLAQNLWGRLLTAPLSAEAQALGDWPLDLGLEGRAGRTLAPALTGDPATWSKTKTAWPAASLLRTL